MSPICPRGDKIFFKNREIPRGCKAEIGDKILSPNVTIVLHFDPVPKIRMEVQQKCDSECDTFVALWQVTTHLHICICNTFVAVSAHFCYTFILGGGFLVFSENRIQT